MCLTALELSLAQSLVYRDGLPPIHIGWTHCLCQSQQSLSREFMGQGVSRQKERLPSCSSMAAVVRCSDKLTMSLLTGFNRKPET